MPIEVNSDTKHIKVSNFYSRLTEIIAIINVLADKKHHKFADVLTEEVNMKLSEESIDMLNLISSMPFQGIELLEIVLDCREFQNLDILIDKMNNYREEQFIRVLTGEQLDLVTIEDIRNNKKEFKNFISEMPWFYRGSDKVFEHILLKTDEFRKKVGALFKEIDSIFYETKIRPMGAEYETAVAEMNKKLDSSSPLAAAEKIMNRKIDDNAAIKQYIFVPSYFISPHYVMAFNNSAYMFLYDIRNDIDVARNQAREKLASALKIMSDKTRLEILRLLILQPSYGKVLANRLNLTTATISHHLEQLKLLNLVSENRDKNTKYFSANIEEIDRLLEGLKNYLYNN